jgi:serine/threonine-protein kinase HipA
MAEIRLFPSTRCAGFFGTKRFDRERHTDGSVRRNHMLSVSAILETSHRIPSLDYNSLMNLTLELTKNYAEVEKVFRLMCFNIFAHNRDDHTKNFSFLFDEENRSWRFAPAYDLTYSNSFGGEHATCVNGNGHNPQIADILAAADKIGLARPKARRIAEQVKETVARELGDTEQYQ